MRGFRLLGRATFEAGEIEDLTPAQVTALLRTFSATVKGLVPAPGTAAGKYLKDDGTWDTPGGGGGGGGDSVTINTVTVTDLDLDDATPGPPSGDLNIKWQKDASSPANVSGYVDVSVLEPLLTLGNLAGTIATAKIADAAVTLAKMADLAQARFIGRADGAGTGVPTALTPAQAITILAPLTAGTYSSVPGSPGTGAAHIVDETGITRRYDGSGWVDYMPGIGRLYNPPTTGWTKTGGSHASATQTAVDGHLRIDLPVAGATARCEHYRAEPAATYEIEIATRAMSVGNAGSTSVLVLGGFYATGTGRAMFLYARGDNLLIVQKDNPLGTFSATARSTTLIQSANVYWFSKIVRDGSNLYFYVSHDRETWIEIFSEAVGTFLTPDRVLGVGLHLAGAAARGAYADVLSWRVI